MIGGRMTVFNCGCARRRQLAAYQPRRSLSWIRHSSESQTRPKLGRRGQNAKPRHAREVALVPSDDAETMRERRRSDPEVMCT
jgi:hypothetical protein